MTFKISCLLFIQDDDSRILLMKRNRSPNLGMWSPPGGKLEMQLGESPIECAKREALEEVGLTLTDDDLRLFGYVSEKNYEGNSHWLMFLVDILPVVKSLPQKLKKVILSFFIVNKLTISKFHQQTTNWFGLFLIKESRGFGVFVLILKKNLLRLRLKQNLFKEIMLN